jgi:hypothetical protein
MDKYNQWWITAKEELNKLPQETPIRSELELLFADLCVNDIPCPDVQFTDEELILTWEERNKKAVIGLAPGSFQSFQMILPELPLGGDIPMSSEQVSQFKNWYLETNPPEQEEEFRPSPPPPGKKHTPADNMLEMMNSMLKSFNLDESFEERDNLPSSPLDAMGEFFQMFLVGFFRLLLWLVDCLPSRIRIRGTIKGLLMDTMRDIQEGYWNDILSSPDKNIYEFSPRIHSLINVIFQGVNVIIRNRLIAVAIVMFVAGYRCAT